MLNRWRLTIFLSVMCLVAAIIIGRLFYVQVLNHKLYSALALGQQAGFEEIQGIRGQIFSENSKESRGSQGNGDVKSLAINKDKWLISAVPKNVKNKNGAALVLSDIIHESTESIMTKLDKPDSYTIIKKELSDQEVAAVKNVLSNNNTATSEKLTGISLENSPGRYYPQEEMASQLIGFLGAADNQGQYGIEGYYDDLLKGKTGIKENKKGLSVIDTTKQADLNGSDLYLTIDYNIQFQAESLLKEEKKKDDIESGQIIVLKPDSGRVLALANFPSFNLNAYSKENDLAVFQNSAVQKLFEPGSVFKPFTMAMALQENKVTPETTFVDTGSVTIGPDTVYNFDHEKYGKQTMSGILEKSINTGAVFLSQKLAHQTFMDYVDKLGFGEKTGIDVQGEVSSKNDMLRNGSAFGFATASFGQGIEMTPIQLARAFCIFANDGRYPKPYVVEKITHGTDTQTTQSVISSQIVSSNTISQVNQMLINVVERGFGDGAKIPGYYLAGKTGTAQVPFENKKGYYPDKTIQSFVGYGPALKPQFLILVKLDDPKVPKSALSAVPIFKKLAQYIINYWQIPPDYTK
jgi:cell division protein FtsI/penicillin-binding protein 2